MTVEVRSTCVEGRTISWIPALLLVAAAGCGPGDDAPSDGGAIRWEVDARPALSVGQIEGEEPYVFANVQGVRLLPEGGVAVADGASGTIRIFGPDGAFVRQMGGEGEGPGEFSGLASIRLRPPDTIVAFDYRNPRTTRFLRSGELVSTTSLTGHDGFPVLVGMYDDGAAAAGWIRPGPRDPEVVSPDRMRVGRFGSDGELGEILVQEPGMRRTSYPEGSQFSYGPIPFSAHFLYGMIGDTLFYTDGLGGVIDVVGPAGDSIRTLHVPFEGWSVREARTRLEPELDSALARDLDGVLDVPGTDSIPTVSALLVDEGRGHLWLKRYDPATDSHWLRTDRVTGGEWAVLETDGRVVARISLPGGLRLMDVRGDRIAGVARDELDVERVRVYEVRR